MKTSDVIGIAAVSAYGVWFLIAPRSAIRFYAWFYSHHERKPPKPFVIRIAGLFVMLVGPLSMIAYVRTDSWRTGDLAGYVALCASCLWSLAISAFGAWMLYAPDSYIRIGNSHSDPPKPIVIRIIGLVWIILVVGTSLWPNQSARLPTHSDPPTAPSLR